MQTKHLAATIGLFCGLLGGLSACVVPNTPGPSASSSSVKANPANSTSAAVSCEQNSTQPEPLSQVTNQSENTLIYDQFNFQPQEIAVAGDTVTITAPHHIFSLCQTNGVWSIVSAEAAEGEETYDYAAELAKIADPDFETIEIDAETYEYRVRLQADWLQEQLRPETTDPEAVEETDSEALVVAPEDAVFFELKKPDGELISEQMYTLSELQDAQLGASLGVPSIVGTSAIASDIWFAATASQGEGNSGFASLLRYDTATGDISIERPDALQGDQLTSLVATESDGKEATTLWMGTKRSGEGNPYFPASGLVSYQPSSQAVTAHTITNSPLVGAIPYQLTVEEETLWVGTGNGVCQVEWAAIESADSWDCWRFTAMAELPDEGVDVYPSFLAAEPAEQLTEDTVEVLWANQSLDQSFSRDADEATPASPRYEVVYEPGFETELSQGAYRINNPVARKAAQSDGDASSLFWPGNQWHWGGDRFSRSLDEVALNLVGGGPYGLVTSNSRNGFDLDSNAIRGEFDLISLTPESTKVRYYSGWIESEGLTVYPTVVPAETTEQAAPNPLTEIAADLTAPQGP